MDAETWQRAKRLIADALERPTSERLAFVQAHCSDVGLLAEIRTFIQDYHDQPTGHLRLPADVADPAEADNLLPGSRVGRYIVVGTIGRGGMGRVFLGEDIQLHRKVALKSLLPSALGSSTERSRVVREARAAAQISHANVATVYDVIEHESRAFIVMEYVEGESLASLLRRERLSADRVVAIGEQLASALVAAHAKGVIHRDLKPANIQVTAGGAVKVLDFGVAGATAAFTTVSAVGGEDQTGSVQPGTRGYMSPEQMWNHHVDERSDIFSAGIVLFEMATGERAYVSTDVLELAAAIAKPVRRADAVDPRVPQALADAIAKALEVTLARRFHTAVELEAALGALRGRPAPVRVEPYRPVSRLNVTRLLVRAALVMLGLSVVLTGLGFLTTWTYNYALERREFQQESFLDWFRWGRMSAIAPVAGVATVFLILALIGVIRNLVVAQSSLGRRLDATSRDRLTHTARRLHFDDASVLASWLLLVSASVVMLSFVHFWPKLKVVLSSLSQWHADDLALFAPIPGSGEPPDMPFDEYRQVFTVIAIGSIVAWYLMGRRTFRSGQSLPWVTAGGWVITFLSVVFLTLPWRIAYQTKVDVYEWDGTRCYQIGARAEQLLLFCPDRVPWKKVVPKTEAKGPVDNAYIFEKFSKPR